MRRKPFVTRKIAAGFMVEYEGAWLTPDGEWNGSVFEGAYFKKRKDACKALELILKYGTDALTRG